MGERVSFLLLTERYAERDEDEQKEMSRRRRGEAGEDVRAAWLVSGFLFF